MSKKVIPWLVAGLVSVSFAVGPALAEKVTAFDGREKITIGGKKYEISGKRTKVTIKGAAGARESIKVGMDCKASGPVGGELTSIAC